MDWLQIGAPLFTLGGGVLGWFMKSKLEELRTIKEELRGERRKIYTEILNPYIRLFADLKGKGQDKALKEITSYDYRKTAFDLNLFGSDEVVSAYNNLMKHAYEAESRGNQDPKEMMQLWGKLLLEIRKSLGNKDTKLDELDMLRGMIKDVDRLCST